MQFKKYEASKSFQHLVEYFWTLESVDGIEDKALYRFVPDAYVDWVFHLGLPWTLKFPDSKSEPINRKCHIFGQIERYVDLSLPNGKLNIFAVKFHPWVAREIWNVDMHYLTNTCIDVHDLDLPHMQVLQEQVCMATTVLERIRHVENYLTPYLNYGTNDSLEMFIKAMDVSTQKIPNNSVGTRRLQQRFKNEIGISSKLFMKTFRINQVIESMKSNPELLLTQLALEHNYFDQSHLIKEFKQFTGYSPSTFLKTINPDGDILNLRIEAF